MGASSNLFADPPFGELDSPLAQACRCHCQQSVNQAAGGDSASGPHCSQISTPLPAVYHAKSHKLQTIEETDEDSVQRYLSWELKVPRLNEIHDHLWLAGRPTSARPLHRQAMLGRTIVITEQVDLHMVRQESRMFLKPMPDYLLSCEFWKSHICKDGDLYESACGFLLSYVWLVTSQSDLKMAQKEDLLSSSITWPGWRSFIKSLLLSINIESPKGVNKRYHYGELRLSRLNWIYRLFSRNTTLTTVVRGYMYGYNQYSDILRRNFAWVLVVFVYLTIVVTAMQLGLATDRLRESAAFQNASYGITVFSIVSPLIIIVIIVVNLLGLSVFNITATISFKSETDRARERLSAEGRYQTA